MDPGRDEQPLSTEAENGVYDWSRDGKWISFGGRDMWIASPSGDRKPFAFLATSFREGGGRFSPDGKWIAYTSDETGRVEVYVRRFAGELRHGREDPGLEEWRRGTGVALRWAGVVLLVGEPERRRTLRRAHGRSEPGRRRARTSTLYSVRALRRRLPAPWTALPGTTCMTPMTVTASSSIARPTRRIDSACC